MEDHLTSILAKAEAGDAESLHLLGLAHLRGDFCLPRDYGAAAGRFRAAAERDHPKALENYARLLLEGLGVPQDVEAAAALLARSGNLGNAEAFVLLGEMSERGDAIPADAGAAAGYYRRAAELGSKEAERLHNNVRVKIQLQELAMESLAQGHRSFRDFGRMIAVMERGRSVSDRMREGLRRLEAMGDPSGLLALSRDILDVGRPDPNVVMAGLHALEELARRGVPEGLYRLGVIALGTRFGPSDPARAKELFAKAAELGHPGAAEELRKLKAA